MNAPKILVDSNKYDEKYIAMVSAEDNTIVGSGTTPEDAPNEAKKEGIATPFLFYVPDKDLVHIYYVS